MDIISKIEQRILAFKVNTKKSGKMKIAGDIQSRIELLEEYWRRYQDLWDDIEKSDTGPQYGDERFDAVENEFVSFRGELKQALTDLTQGAVNPPNNVPQGGQGDNGIRMKAIDTPTFSGELEDWISFRDLFTSIVIKNATLSDIHRLQHLKIACKGKAAELIQNIEVTTNNFKTAWDILQGRFENKRLLVSRMLERLMDVPAMKRECRIELGRLLDGTNQMLRALEVLERPVDEWDDWLVVQTTRKLDYATRLAWEKSISATTDMPTYVDLEKFLSGVLRSFEAVKDLQGNRQGQTNAGASNEKRFARTHVATTSENGCLMCHGSHGLYNCPKFLEMSVAARRKFIEDERICFNCIGTRKHVSRECSSRYCCRECKRRHHTLLHSEEDQPSNTKQQKGAYQNPFKGGSSSVSANVCLSSSSDSNLDVNPDTVLLATAMVRTMASNGRTSQLRALIDPAAQWSLITESAATRLAAKKLPTKYGVMGVGETPTISSSKCVRLEVSSMLQREKKINIVAIVIPKLVSRLPNQVLTRAKWLETLPLADEDFEKPGAIDILLGADVYVDILQQGVKRGEGSTVLAQETIFGWIVTGKANATPAASIFTTQVKLDDMLQRFWEQEETQRQSTMSADDEECEEIYQRTTIRGDDGRYIVEIPFRQGERELGESQASAVRRLIAMERKGSQNQQMYDGYREFIATYLRLGHMERIADKEINETPHYYMPHHAVFKPGSSTTKLRVVFDASAVTTNGKCLNELMLTGPRLQETLSTILMRWRCHRVAVTADIEKMYRQIWVNQRHCDYQRIVWRDNPNAKIEHYRLKTVTYGTASAPYMAVKTLQRLAIDEMNVYPRAAAALLNDFYVDDLMTGADSIEDACSLKDELMSITTAGGLRLLKWSSNNKEFLETLPPSYIECHGPLRIEEDPHIKALGVHWHPTADELGYVVNVSEKKEAMSKRQISSEIARLFDPLGLLAPTIITAKAFLQKLWLTGLGWDDVLPDEVRNQWAMYQQELHYIETIRIPRWLGLSSSTISLQLHGFSDASQTAFAACVYSRVQEADGSVVVTLLTAKTKVAPVKQQSIPRLELNGAVLLSRLLRECRHSLRCEEVEMIAWTDSMVVLAWLRRHANCWPTFIANRVSEIQASMNSTQWQHVPGTDNPADVASRGIMPSQLKEHQLWWKGPRWLCQTKDKWPIQKQLIVDESLMEEKRVAQCQIVQVEPMWEVAERFSSWRKLLRVTAYCLRMRPTKGEKTSGREPISADEMEEAGNVWVRLAQKHEFGDISRLLMNEAVLRKVGLQRLRPLIDATGVLRIGGRLANAQMTYGEQHPIILPKKNIITILIINEAHERVHHGGPQNTMAHLQQKYWILQGRQQVRFQIHKCVTCARAKPRMQQQIMGTLPEARVRASRPFLHTGLDYAGPIWTRTAKGRGNKSHKSWIAIFICFGSKAVHLELVSDVSSAAFIAAFRRFTARRGLCSHIYCDNGTNFVGADREMRTELANSMRDEKWRAILADSGTTFHFAPPGSPHFNGLAESAVKMAKSAMRKVIGTNTLTFEEMATFLAQVEAALNSRPICAISSDGNDENVLTPGHFIIGQPLTAVPERNTINEKMSLINRWHLVQQLTQHFWNRWSKEYLHQLQQRHKWAEPRTSIKVGDIVVIHDEMLHSSRWKLGKIVEVHPGVDGHVRVASVRTSNTIIKRAIVKLSVLPVIEH